MKASKPKAATHYIYIKTGAPLEAPRKHLTLNPMPAYYIEYNHSGMKPDYRGKALKYANSEKEAASLIGRYCAKTKTIIDKRRNLRYNVEIHEEKT